MCIVYHENDTGFRCVSQNMRHEEALDIESILLASMLLALTNRIDRTSNGVLCPRV